MALRGTTIPAGCPEGLLFVPESVRTSVLQWGHSSGLACHPGATRTCMLIKHQLGATASLSSGYHPQTNGQAERANQDLERVLRCVASAEPSSWSSRLTMVEYAHNSLPVSSMGLSPFQCCLGYQPPLFPSQESDAIVPSAHASVLGGLPEKPSPGLARGTRRRRTVTVLSPHFTCVVRRSGCPLRTLPSDSSHVNWDPNSLDRSSSPKCSVRCRCDSN